MAKYLVIVESPGKITKISSFLGKDYKTIASYGHIRELEKGSKGVDKKNDFAPSYKVSEDKKDVVKTMKDLIKGVECVYLASDNDLEGEAISWHVKEVLGLTEKQYKRASFIEITKKAIEDAIANPRKIDMDKVNAQQARRVLDRLVGFDLSPLLWFKIGDRKLSAGRVQSVAVRLMVEREREISGFESDCDFKTVGTFQNNTKHKIKTILNKRFAKKEDSKKFLENCIDKSFIIKEIETKPGKKTSSAPFTTSTLQQAASNQFGFSVDRTMKASQKLYESGEISYMRTDSVTLSEDSLIAAGNEIKSRYGDKYHQLKKYTTKSKGAQEAHEAIRPTHFEKKSAGATGDEQKIYELIWCKTIASQMTDAIVDRTTATIGADGIKENFIAKGEVIKFDGFTKVYTEYKEESEEDDTKALPPLKKGEKLDMIEISSAQSFTKPPGRYTEANLVKKMEELGIGRPSTYASIIKTIQDRGYIEKKSIEPKERKIESLVLTGKKIDEYSKSENYGSEKNKLVATDIGKVVTDFLVANFKEILDYKFTAGVEEQLDEISAGKLNWTKMLTAFYGPFSELLKLANDAEGKEDRQLGNDPVSGKPVIARIGKFGAMVQLGASIPKPPKEPKPKKGEKPKPKVEVNPEDKPKFAKLKEGQSIETITLEEAIALLSWPRNLGQHKGEDVTVAIGRFGPYIKLAGEYTSIKEPDTPEGIDLKRALELIEEKIAAKKAYIIKDFKSKEIQVLNGKFGAYIKAPGGNYKIPPEKEADKLTLSDCEEIISKGKAPSKRGGFKKKAAKKKGK